ncbi:MAG: hypothetical protein K2X27_01635 [Candidatus Obscuribacterales bacterium]|nr:hypothetical protein [Candidatus Obscuribacterales bacterium]
MAERVESRGVEENKGDSGLSAQFAGDFTGSLTSKIEQKAQSAELVQKSYLPNTEINNSKAAENPNDKIPSPEEAAANLKSLPPEQRLAYAKELCRRTFVENPRYQAVTETVEDKDGNKKEVLVDFDLVNHKSDGSVERRDLFDAPRGAAVNADRLEQVKDAVSPAVKLLEEMRDKFRNGNMLGKNEGEPLNPPTKMGSPEFVMAQAIEEQLDKELQAKGYDEQFRKDAKAALREMSGQALLEHRAIDDARAEQKGKKPTQEDRELNKAMNEYEKKMKAEEAAWNKALESLHFID